MRKTVAIIFLIMLTGFAGANDNLMLIEEANKNYCEDNFEKAIELYQKAIDNGVESSELYYNLGNAYFKINSIPSAILYYEKAEKINPNDDDILFNLQIANNRIVDKIEQVPEIFYVRWWRNILYTFTVDEWGYLSLVSFAIVVIMLLIFFLTNIYWAKKISFWLGLVFIFIAGTSYLMANQKYNSFIKDHQAIVFTPTLTVKSSPSDSGIDLFVIHEGSKVQITDHVGEWYEIELANGSVGWIKENDIQKI